MRWGWVLLLLLLATPILAFAAVHIDDQQIILGSGAVILTGASNGTLLVNGAQIGGTQGPAGPQGPVGETGPAGEQGSQGVKGDTGETGAQGQQGTQGIQGIPGDPGPKGDTGDAGAPGAAWYDGTGPPPGGLGVDGDYYLDDETGYVYLKDTTWTLTASIMGPEGPEGAQGEQGIQGIQGIQGFNGTQGIQGIQGIQGFNGTQGIQGIQGIQGFNGTQGIQGVKGDTGDKGDKGNTGDTGPQGPAGYSAPVYMQYPLIQSYPFGGTPTTLTPTTHSATVARVFPFEINRNITVTVVTIRTNAVVASCLILGIFNSAGTRLWQSGALSTVATNTMAVTANLPVTLTAGTYYFATTNNNAVSSTAAYTVTPAVGSTGFPRWGTVATSNGAMPASITPTGITETTGGWMCYVQLSYVTT